MKLKGKIALVTGGGSGIGEAIAKTLAKEGAVVIVCGRNEKNLNAVADKITSANGVAYPLKLDVSSEQDWIAGRDFIQEKFGMLHVLVNNSGILLDATIKNTSLSEWEAVQKTNVTGAFLGIKYMGDALIASKNGSIINVASDSSEVVCAGLAAYGVSKAAIKMLSRCAAAEYYKYNVRCNTVHPSWVDTKMVHEYSQTGGASIQLDSQYFTPLGRVVTAQDVANMILYLASDDARNVNGAAFVIDGGGSSFITDLPSNALAGKKEK